MYYALKKDVFLVRGKAKGCVYDLHNSKLYSVNSALFHKLDEINRGLIVEGNIKDEMLLNTIRELEHLGILELSEQISNNDILSIAKKELNVRFAWIEITGKCNLRCIHCYNDSEPRTCNEMSVSDYKMVVDKLIDLGIKQIQIIGGEPFINAVKLKELLDYSIGKFDFIEIFTNGTLIPDTFYQYLALNGIHIALSVYSYIPEMHNKVTGNKESYGLTNRTIELLKKNNIPYRVCNVLMRDIELGEKNTGLYTLRRDKDIVRMSGRANIQLLSDELLEKKIITKSSFNKPLSYAVCQRNVSGHNCFGERIYVSSDLTVYPCVMERRFSHCQICNHHSLCLNSSIVHMTKDQIKGCADCEFRYACFDCRSDALSTDIYDKPWYCTYNPELGEWEPPTDFIRRIGKLFKESENQ